MKSEICDAVGNMSKASAAVINDMKWDRIKLSNNMNSDVLAETLPDYVDENGVGHYTGDPNNVLVLNADFWCAESGTFDYLDSGGFAVDDPQIQESFEHALSALLEHEALHQFDSGQTIDYNANPPVVTPIMANNVDEVNAYMIQLLYLDNVLSMYPDDSVIDRGAIEDIIDDVLDAGKSYLCAVINANPPVMVIVP